MLLLSCLLLAVSYTSCNVIVVYVKEKARQEGYFPQLVEDEYYFGGAALFVLGITVLIVTFYFWSRNHK